MAIKIDPNKDFDSLKRDFIKNYLSHFGFPSLSIKMIMSCICTIFTSISINRLLTNEFFLSHGICQGNPISPYIFILCMECFSFLTEQKCQLGSWKPLKASRNRPSFTHVLFVDYILLFSKVQIFTTLV